MIFFLDEIVGMEWVLDFNQFPYVFNASGSLMRNLDTKIREGKLLDPRDPNATKESREEFGKYVNEQIPKRKEKYYTHGFLSDCTENDIELYIDSTLLETKIMAITPHQGYINAPYHYFPEELKEIYEKGELDRKLDPRIPAIYRYNFPKELREKILEFGRKNGVRG